MAALLAAAGCSGTSSGASGGLEKTNIVVDAFGAIDSAGLFIAHAWESGSMHAAGLGLFVTSGVIVFLDIKHVFDRMNSGAP